MGRRADAVLVLRSVAFNLLFYLNLILHVIAAIPTFALPRSMFMALAKSWGRTSNALIAVAGIRVELRGLEKIPPGALLVAAKHQSVWETFTLLTLFDDPAYVFKRELMWIPVFGWYAWKSDMIPVDRAARGGAVAGMVARARNEFARGRQIIIFPEGTRVAPGTHKPYQPGIAALYGQLNVPVIPVALNSGLFWGRKAWVKKPGEILIQYLPAIPPGLDRRAFMAELEQRLEPAAQRLLTGAP
jgi:1-acyl-sn-glycerol-3-phosphate acyltransferase